MIHYPKAGRSEVRSLATHHIVVVEGLDDALVYERIFLSRFSGDQFEVVVCGGYRQMQNLIPVLLQVRGSQEIWSLTLARDCDDDPASALRSMQNLLNSSGLAVPTGSFLLMKPHANESFPRTIQTGILLMPPSSPGAIETLLYSNHKFHAAKPIIEQTFLPAIDAIDSPSSSAREFTSGKAAKRYFGALMSLGQRESNTPPYVSLRLALEKYAVLDINAGVEFAPYRTYVASLP